MHMAFSTTNKAACQQYKSSLLLPLGRKKINDKVTWITIDCDECRTHCQYKNHSKENTATIICDILNHSQKNFVIEIKPISWSNFFQKWISKSKP